ncbi:fumarylacetoacetate hydrolase family protein [Noviherbaspirillum saxi]|uniref:FAA hydrolase family protein n=1 Tax=Noviherbaspirillum saxi TaxID=2320863 RepID=A0A3A3G5X5_9BURK|nr:fumarylacetoacetate hydrolase family protein [Noviherbaspirillum saxi]RJF95580.1 FAA hydrolase family protein [Noviherbaspirillum saxi]
MAFIFPPEDPVVVPVVGTSDSIAVRRIYCVGRNYAAHAREMGFDPDREPPFFFLKPDNAVVPVAYDQVLELDYPSETQNYHYEAELVAVIGKSGSNVPLEQALEYVWGYAVGLDMTRRDLQMKMREMGRPWEIGKAFDRSAPIGPIHPATSVGHIAMADLWLTVNGDTKQKSNVTHLIWSVAETVAYLSKFFRLEPGDLIYTGTPEGVGPVTTGDTIRVGVDRLGELTVRIV